MRFSAILSDPSFFPFLGGTTFLLFFLGNFFTSGPFFLRRRDEDELNSFKTINFKRDLMTSEQVAVLAPSRSGGAGLSPLPSSVGVEDGIEDVQVERVLENDLPLLSKSLDEPSSNWSSKYTRNKCSTPPRSLYKCPEKRDLPVEKSIVL